MPNSINPFLVMSRSSHQRCSIKKLVLKISENSQENTCARVSFLIKLHACNFIKKETLTQFFSREFCEIAKNNFSTEHLRTTASARLVLFQSFPIFLSNSLRRNNRTNWIRINSKILLTIMSYTLYLKLI